VRPRNKFDAHTPLETAPATVSDTENSNDARAAGDSDDARDDAQVAVDNAWAAMDVAGAGESARMLGDDVWVARDNVRAVGDARMADKTHEQPGTMVRHALTAQSWPETMHGRRDSTRRVKNKAQAVGDGMEAAEVERRTAGNM
jgi:hypothetical protein